MNYDLPDVISIEEEGPLRIVRLNRPDHLNAISEELHLGLTRVFPQLSADRGARVAVLTGEGRAFSAGGDFDLLDRMARDMELRRETIDEGRELVLNMLRCRIPVVAAVNGPAVGLGCSLIALSDVVYMAESPTSPTPMFRSASWQQTEAHSPGPCTPASSWPRNTPSPANGSPPGERPRSDSPIMSAPTERFWRRHGKRLTR